MPTKRDGIARAKPLDQAEGDRHGGELRDMVEDDLQPTVADPLDDLGIGGEQALVGDALVVEGRQHHDRGDAEGQGVRVSIDRFGQRGNARCRAGAEIGRDAAFVPRPPAGPCALRWRTSWPRRSCRAGRRRRSPHRAGADSAARTLCDRALRSACDWGQRRRRTRRSDRHCRSSRPSPLVNTRSR